MCGEACAWSVCKLFPSSLTDAAHTGSVPESPQVFLSQDGWDHHHSVTAAADYKIQRGNKGVTEAEATECRGGECAGLPSQPLDCVLG